MLFLAERNLVKNVYLLPSKICGVSFFVISMLRSLLTAVSEVYQTSSSYVDSEAMDGAVSLASRIGKESIVLVKSGQSAFSLVVADCFSAPF